MAVRLLFLWSTHSLLTLVTIAKVLIGVLAVWASLTVFGTRVLGWIFADPTLAGCDLDSDIQQA